MDGQNFFVESQNCPNFKSCVGNEPPRSIFLPKKQPTSKNQRIPKSAWQSVTFHYGPLVKNLWLTFVPIFFPGFSTCILTPKFFGAKMSILDFSWWLCNKRSSLKRQLQKELETTIFTNLGSREAPRADLHMKSRSTRGHKFLIQRRLSVSHQFFFRHKIPALNYHTHARVLLMFSNLTTTHSNVLRAVKIFFCAFLYLSASPTVLRTLGRDNNFYKKLPLRQNLTQWKKLF